jgi:hypothetical protein
MAMKVTVNWGLLQAIPAGLVIAAGAYGIYNVDWGFSRGEITDYALQCTAYDSTGQRCVGSYFQSAVTVYTVHKSEQYVISQVQGQPPSRLTKCAIVDRGNWKCNGESGADWDVVSYADGQLVTPPAGMRAPYYRHVSRVEWLEAQSR